jgi:hypothetical protein
MYETHKCMNILMMLFFKFSKENFNPYTFYHSHEFNYYKIRCNFLELTNKKVLQCELEITQCELT